jgi:hypothetical protein
VKDTTADDRIPGREQAVFRVQLPSEHDPQQGRERYPRYPHPLERKREPEWHGILPIKAGSFSGDPPPDGSEFPVYEPGILSPSRPLQMLSSAAMSDARITQHPPLCRH